MFSAQKIAQITGGKFTGGKTIDGSTWHATAITTDTRTLAPQSLFVALVGNNFDGHNFAADALNKGAAGVLVQREVPDIPPEKQIIVPDTLTAMAALGKHLRQNFKGQIVAITGSAGKTTTREGLKAVLSHYGESYGTRQNYNNHIGVPLTLANLPENTDFGVFEMAMNHSGEIAHLTHMVQPNIALITNIYPMHIENFTDLAGIAHAKAEIFEGLPQNGTAIFNADAHHADILRQKAEALGIENILTFGVTGDIAVKSHTEENGQSLVQVDVAGDVLEFCLSSPGTHRVYNALAILAAVTALGLDPAKAAHHLDDAPALPGRGQTTRLALPNGGHATLIDESYSGQPEAMRLALQNLRHTTPENNGRRLAVLGQMAELGTHSAAEHTSVGEVAAKAGLAEIIGVGEDVKPLLLAAEETTATQFRPNVNGLAKELLNARLQDGDVLLIKGSRYSSRVFEVVDALGATHQHANEHVDDAEAS